MTDEKSEAPLGDLLGEELRKKLEADHGEIVAVQTKSGVAAFRVFTKGEYDAYNKILIDEKRRPEAFGLLVRTCVVHPDKATFNAWVDKYPAIVTTCISHVLELGGLNAEAEAKKYGSA